MSNPPAFDDLPLDEMGQAAFTAYVDAAQGTEKPHDRLSNGARASARAVAGVLRDAGLIRMPLQRTAVHGTTGGYNAGCRCQFCRDADNLYQRAVRHNKGDNKV